MIQSSRIAINSPQAMAQVGALIDPDQDKIFVDGKIFEAAVSKRPRFLLLNKPQGTLSSRKSQGGVPTIYSLLPPLPDFQSLNYAGRLDRDTEGLLLLSNDGEWIHRSSHPKFKVPKHYQVHVAQPLMQSDIKRMCTEGIELEDGPVILDRVKDLGLVSPGLWGYHVETCEGRKRMIRRCFAAVKRPVLRLVRTSYAGLSRDPTMKAGSYRWLDKTEIAKLYRQVGMEVSL